MHTQEKDFFQASDLSQPNAFGSALMMEGWARLGVEQAVVCPGSRNSPLLCAVAGQSAIQAWPVLDERVAGFFALGLAKASGLPVLLLCTSGTAAANFLPAVIEARQSGVPLLVLTADRPAEMRDCHSGQTIDQVKLFGDYPLWQKEFPLPSTDAAVLRALRQNVVHAFVQAMAGGPVHLNLPFRDPLVPGQEALPELQGFAVDDFWRGCQEQLGCLQEQRLRAPLPPSLGAAKGLIVAGPQVTWAEAEALLALSQRLGWPLVADALSSLRGLRTDRVISHYDLFLRQDELAAALRPDRVMLVGPLPTSKVLRQRLREWDADVFVLQHGGDLVDGLHQRGIALPQDVASLVEALAQQETGGPDVAYGESWQQAELSAEQGLAELWPSRPDLCEVGLARVLAGGLSRPCAIFVGNSTPIRDVESFWPQTDMPHVFYANRGANGIDGVVATAAGVAQAGGETLLLVGDLSCLHDSNALLLQAHLQGSLTIVLINNKGGGIFEMLPAAKLDCFEEYFATPQAVAWPDLCAGYGVPYERVQTEEHLWALLAEEASPGIRVWEIQADRKVDSVLRKSWYGFFSEPK